MNNNHLGTAFQVMREIAEEQNWNYSNGTLTEHSLKAVTVYPLLHVNVQTISATDVQAEIQLNVAVMDITNRMTTENQQLDLSEVYSKIGYTENENYSHILQQLYVAMMRSIFQKEQEYYSQIQFTRPISFVPFIQDGDDVLTGYNITLTMIVINPWVTDGTCYAI